MKNIELDLTTEELAMIIGVIDNQLKKWSVFLENPLFDRRYYDKLSFANEKIKNSVLKGE